MKLNIGKNMSDSLKPNELKDMGIALLVPFWNSLVPTLIGLNGWWGFLTGYVVPLLVGLGLKQKAIIIAALTLMVQHLIYHFGQEMLENKEKGEGLNNGNGIWSLDENKLRWVKDEAGNVIPNVNFGLKDAATEYVRYGELPAGARMMNVGGENVAVYGRETMNDYVRIEGTTMNDYINNGSEVSLKQLKTSNQVI